jgi:hypothetical protein
MTKPIDIRIDLELSVIRSADSDDFLISVWVRMMDHAGVERTDADYVLTFTQCGYAKDFRTAQAAADVASTAAHALEQAAGALAGIKPAMIGVSRADVFKAIMNAMDAEEARAAIARMDAALERASA